MLRSVMDSILILAALLNLAMLATSRMAACIRTFAVQSLLLALLPVAVGFSHDAAPGVHVFAIAAGTMGLKVLLIPWILLRVLRSGEIHREVEPFIGFTASVLLGALIIVASFAFADGMPLPSRAPTDLLVPVAVATLFNGLLILVSRAKAITQVLGYLVVENGVFVFGLLLLDQTPALVELGILLDLFVGVFIMGIVVYHIRREFDHMDTHLLDALRES
ncbi:MAG: hydrogenase [Phycisphaerales bacterium]|nr:hydrogenase [Phycisphaerales bacterium]